MTETEWQLQSCDPGRMLEQVLPTCSRRRHRLLACAMCRQIWEELTDDRWRRAVAVAENFADGLVTEAALREAERAARFTAFSAYGYTWDAAWAAAATCDADQIRVSPKAIDAYSPRVSVIDSIRDIFGNPFRPAVIDSAWLTWQDQTIVKLAQAAYDERALPSGHLDRARLAIVADALEEAGCTTDDILAHLRGPGPHVRGCWVVDLLLGKE